MNKKRAVNQTLDSMRQNLGLSFTVVPLLLYHDELGTFMVYPTAEEILYESSIVFLSSQITDYMETGKLYAYGVSNSPQSEPSFHWLVKVAIDSKSLFTTEEPDLEHTACLIIPHDRLLEWAGNEPQE